MSWKHAAAVRNHILGQWSNDGYIDAWQEIGEREHMQSSLPRQMIPAFQQKVLPRSTLYYVADSAMEQVGAAAPSFEPEALLASDFPTPCGFMVLSKVLYAYAYDEHGNDRDDDAVVYGVEHRDSTKTHTNGPIIISWCPIQRRPEGHPGEGDFLVDFSKLDRPGDGVCITAYQKTPNGTHYWPVAIAATPFNFVFSKYMDDGVTGNANYSFMRGLQVLLALMNQQVFASKIETAGSKKSKRASKSQPINVVYLPHPKEGGEGKGGEGNYSVRWMVAGHWRNQWYPSLSTHRQKWIRAHIKGPGDAPFKHTARVMVAK